MINIPKIIIEPLIDLWGEKKKKNLLKNGVTEGRRNREKKNRRDAVRERNLWEEKRLEGVIVRVWEERKNKGRRRNERVYCEKSWMSKRKYFFISQKNIIFIGVMRRIRQREIVFLFFLVLLKQPIENKHYFYKSFSLTQDSFPSTKFFFMLPNTEKCGKLSL